MFQERAATSRKTLPITIVYGLVMSVLFGVIDKGLWLQFACVAIATYVMVIINNYYSLIRVYSRLVSCAFLVLTIMSARLNNLPEADIAQVLFAIHLFLLFKTYQEKESMGTVCASFLMIGAISTMFIQILFLVPFLWIILGTRMQVGSAKNYMASVIGLIIPYWFWGAYGLWTHNYTYIIDHVASIANIYPISTDILEPHLLITLTFISILGICGALRFIRYSYYDSIKTRMLFYSMITLFILILVFIILQPQHSSFLLKILLITVSPLIAHYFTFTKSWLTNYFFISSLIITILLTIYNTWVP
jgi:hypothetical protein